MPRDRTSAAWRRGWLACACAALSGSALAAPLDLAQAWQAALANDAQLRAARATAEATRERVPQAQAQLRPQVNLNMQRNRNELRSESAGILGESKDLAATDRAMGEAALLPDELVVLTRK